MVFRRPHFSVLHTKQTSPSQCLKENWAGSGPSQTLSAQQLTWKAPGWNPEGGTNPQQGRISLWGQFHSAAGQGVSREVWTQRPTPSGQTSREDALNPKRERLCARLMRKAQKHTLHKQKLPPTPGQTGTASLGGLGKTSALPSVLARLEGKPFQPPHPTRISP